VTAVDAGRASTVALADRRWPFFMLGTASRRVWGPQSVDVEAAIKNPRVGWFARHEKRGYSLDQVPLTPEQRANLGRAGLPGLGRLVKPDPLSNRVVGLTGDLCLVSGNGSSACSESMHEFFSRGPLNVMYTSADSSEFAGLD